MVNINSESQSSMSINARVEETKVQTQIAICIPTYKRPEGLRRLLAALGAQEPLPGCQVTIVVVDNEGSSQAKEICDEFASQSRYPLRYCCELQRGLSRVRNKAFEIAAGFADTLVFIDDDEVPSREWLRHLVACQQAYGADAVSGPVIPHFMSEVPRWISTGRFFNRNRYATGRSLLWAGAGNVLVRKEVFDRIGLFDDRFALTGGEDTDFFTRLSQLGGLICWADEAIVEEWVPASRTTLKYILQGAYRIGMNAGLRARKSKSPAMTLRCVVRGALQGIEGICHLLASLTYGRAEAAKGLQLLYGCSGVITGLAGIRYEHYRTVHTI